MSGAINQSINDALAGLSPEQRELLLCRASPAYWLKQKTGETPWRKQAEVMHAIAVHDRVAVASGHAVGKSWLAARLVCWFLDVFHPATVITTAPTNNQVKKVLWMEIHAAHAAAKRNGHPLRGELLTVEWRIKTPDGRIQMAVGFAPRDYDYNRFQGFHNEHMLVIEDEAAGISREITQGINSVLKGAFSRWLKIGNPTETSGPFYEAFSDPTSDWRTFHISEFEVPNVDLKLPAHRPDEDSMARKELVRASLRALIDKPVKFPGLATAKDILRDFNAWGEDHAMWKARVLGQFPDRTSDTLISLSWLERAGAETMDEIAINSETTIEIGVDVARYGTDDTWFVAKIGNRPYQGNAFAPERHSQQSTMETVGRIVSFVRRLRAHFGEICPKIRIKIDAIGLGAGVFDRAEEVFSDGDWRDPAGNRLVECYDMIAAAVAHDPIQYANATTEWWARTARGLESGEIGGPVFADRELQKQLQSRKYKYQSDGRMRLESKDDLRRRGEHSPDFGDAVMLAFCDLPMSIEDTPSSGIHAGEIYGR